MANKTNKEANTRIGGLFQRTREQHGITQAEMAAATGMSKNQISAIERGQSKASVELLLNYCRKCGVTPNELLQTEEPGEILPELRKMLGEQDPVFQDKLLEIIRLIRE